MKALLALVLFTCSVSASVGYIQDFNYQLTDIANHKVSKEGLFANMLRRGVDLENSICSNKAHVWAYEFKRRHKIRAGKIFVFFGGSVWANERKGWMYHVAPYIVENSQEWVMEASYPEVTKPLSVEDWLENETDARVKAHQCIEIFADDTDLTAYFYQRYNLPERRENKPGAICYYRKVPGHYWFPTSIAYHDLKKDAAGRSIDYAPKGFDKDDVLHACVEIMTSKFSRFLGGGRKECKKLLNL
jgi:hypothetical protein